MSEQDILNNKTIYILTGGRIRPELDRLDKDEESGDWYREPMSFLLYLAGQRAELSTEWRRLRNLVFL